MPKVTLNLPSLMAVVATRAALAFGVGLLVADRIPMHRRKKIALALIGIGAVTTVPLARSVIRGKSPNRLTDGRPSL